jgi:hypothetical protein
VTQATSDVFPDRPAFGATQFIGRVRLAQNLLSRLHQGQSVLLYGGPKLGKTSMLLHLKWLVDQNSGKAETTPAFYMDLADEDARKQLLHGPGTRPSPILLLDNCDHLLQEYGVGALRELIQSDRNAGAHAIVWAGAPAWHDAVREQVRI